MPPSLDDMKQQVWTALWMLPESHKPWHQDTLRALPTFGLVLHSLCFLELLADANAEGKRGFLSYVPDTIWVQVEFIIMASPSLVLNKQVSFRHLNDAKVIEEFQMWADWSLSPSFTIGPEQTVCKGHLLLAWRWSSSPDLLPDSASPDFCYTCIDLGSCFKHPLLRRPNCNIHKFQTQLCIWLHMFLVTSVSQEDHKCEDRWRFQTFKLRLCDRHASWRGHWYSRQSTQKRTFKEHLRNKLLSRTFYTTCILFSSLKHWCHSCPISPREPSSAGGLFTAKTPGWVHCF